MKILPRTFLGFWIASVFAALISMGMISIASAGNRIQPLSLALPELRACVEESVRAPNASEATRVAAQCRILSIRDASKTELLISRDSLEIHSLSNGVTAQRPISLRATPHGILVAFDTPVNNAQVVAVAMVPMKGLDPLPLLWLLMVVGAVVSAIACLVLARHAVAPIRKLRLSTELFGHGELDSRPDPSLLSRSDELGDLSKTIGQMSSRISGLLSAQKTFLIQVAHELGSPLTRLNVALGLARRKANPELKPELDRIQKESSEVNSMVQQLLSLASLESGFEREGQEAFPLDELVEEVCSDNRIIATETGKRIHLVSSPQVMLWGYRELLKRALDNVLRNALHFTPEGSCVEVDVRRNPNTDVLIQVRDSGKGVQDDELNAIFEPFVRGSSDRSGTGLGLAIAKRAVLANRGTIRAVNLEQGGLLIEISLTCEPNNMTAKDDTLDSAQYAGIN